MFCDNRDEEKEGQPRVSSRTIKYSAQNLKPGRYWSIGRFTRSHVLFNGFLQKRSVSTPEI